MRKEDSNKLINERGNIIIDTTKIGSDEITMNNYILANRITKNKWTKSKSIPLPKTESWGDGKSKQTNNT